MPTYQLGPEEQRVAVNLAMAIECGTVDINEVLQVMRQDAFVTRAIMWFWCNFNDMTRRALQLVANHDAVQHLEKCYTQTSTEHPEVEQ